MESIKDNNNQLMFLSEIKELRNELSAMKARIDQLEESNEKQQERLDILERENHALKKKIELNTLNGIGEGGSFLKRKRTDQDQVHDEQIESRSTPALASVGKKKTKTNNSNDEEAVVISRRDNGDSFDSLGDDLLHKIVEFDGNCYEKFGSINKRCKNIYDVKEYKLKKKTCFYGYGTVDMMLERYLQKRKEFVSVVRLNISKAVVIYNRLDAIDWIIQLGDFWLIKSVCSYAASYGRINILTNVFLKCNLTILNKLLDDQLSLCFGAALNGKLETLKCLRKYGAELDEDTFSIARDREYDEIVQYLRAEGCPEPPEDTDESSGSERLGSGDEDGDY